ncbi:MAG TPA: hypothetical protein VFA01_05980 [Candidatus Dormibacteraeota bacterium]|jgi:hypothetical protein|nr:hypothetical protein [Candidatus Dormibacteraeota bacterium]
MSASRARWIAVWLLVALWLLAQSLDLGGNWSHVLVLAAIALLIYELAAEEPEAA